MIISSKDIGSLIRQERTKHGWSQTELGELAGVQQTWISQVERGKPTAQIGLVLQVLRALQLSLYAEPARKEEINLDQLLESSEGKGTIDE